MNEDFDALISGVRAGNAGLSAKTGKAKDHSKQPLLYGWGYSLSQGMHFVATADTQTELKRDESDYDSIAQSINEHFGKVVAETHEGKPVGHVGFIHPETGEGVSFYG